jgi:hypothetical protein
MGNQGDLGKLSHERANWKFEHWGWLAIGGVLVAALLGVLGPGPLSKATAGQKGSNLWVEYQRFGRYESASELRIHVGERGLSTALPALTINRKYLEKVTVEDIEPQPEQVKAAGDEFIYVFAFAATNKPTTITMKIRGNGYGKLPVHLKFSDAADVRFSQLFYP